MRKQGQLRTGKLTRLQKVIKGTKKVGIQRSGSGRGEGRINDQKNIQPPRTNIQRSDQTTKHQPAFGSDLEFNRPAAFIEALDYGFQLLERE